MARLRFTAAALVAALVAAAAAPAATAPIVVTRVPMDAGPTGIGYGHGQLWATRDDGTVARLDPRTGRQLGVTRVGRFPARVALDRRSAWVVDEDTGRLTRLDASDGRVVRRTRVCPVPTGVAVGARAVWVACWDGRLVRVDPRSGRVTARTLLGPSPAHPPDLTATRRQVWVTGDDRVVRVDPATAAVTATVPAPSPTDVTVGAGALWVADIDARRVTRIDRARAAVTGTFRTRGGPSGVTVAWGRVWVLANGDSTVSELDPRTGRRLATVAIGPHSFDIARGGGAVWAQSYSAQSLFRITLAAFTRPG